MKKLFLVLLLTLGYSANSSAESVYVKYHGVVPLNSFYCEYTQSSFVNRICYQQQNNYVVVLLNGTYYPFCGVPFNAVKDWLNSYSKGSFYNSYIGGAFDCRVNNAPQTLSDMGRGIGNSMGKVIIDMLNSN